MRGPPSQQAEELHFCTLNHSQLVVPMALEDSVIASDVSYDITSSHMKKLMPLLFGRNTKKHQRSMDLIKSLLLASNYRSCSAFFSLTVISSWPFLWHRPYQSLFYLLPFYSQLCKVNTLAKHKRVCIVLVDLDLC